MPSDLSSSSPYPATTGHYHPDLFVCFTFIWHFNHTCIFLYTRLKMCLYVLNLDTDSNSMDVFAAFGGRWSVLIHETLIHFIFIHNLISHYMKEPPFIYQCVCYGQLGHVISTTINSTAMSSCAYVLQFLWGMYLKGRLLVCSRAREQAYAGSQEPTVKSSKMLSTGF